MRLASIMALAAVVVALLPHWSWPQLSYARLGVALVFLAVSASLLVKTMHLPSVATVAARLAPAAAAVVKKPAQSKSVASRHAKWGQPDRGAVGDREGADATEDAYMQGPVKMHPITMEFSSMAMERKYRAAVFASSHGIHQVIPVLIAALGYAACTLEHSRRPGGSVASAPRSRSVFSQLATGGADSPAGGEAEQGRGGRGCLFYSWVLPAHVTWMLLRWAASKLHDQGRAQRIFSYVVQTVCMGVNIGASGHLLCAPSSASFLAQHGFRLQCTEPSGPSTASSAASLQLVLILAIYLMNAVGIAFYSRCLFACAVLASAAASAILSSSEAEEVEMSLKVVAVVISSLLLRLHEKQQRELFMQVSQAKRLHILRLAADSRLSHLLKNRAASARFLCEKLALDWRDMPPAARETIEQLGEQNRQMINWSHLHDMVLQLQAGTYQTSPSCAVVTDLLRACLPAEFAIDDSACPSVLMFDEQITRIMLEEAASNAAKYGEPGASRCRITFGLDPHTDSSTRSKAGRGPQSQSVSPVAGRMHASLSSAARPQAHFLYLTLSSQHTSSFPQLEPAALGFGNSSRGLDRIFVERGAEIQTAPAVVRRRPSCASPSPSGTPSIGRTFPPRALTVSGNLVPSSMMVNASTGPSFFCLNRDSREASSAAPGTPLSESNSVVSSSAANSVAASPYIPHGGPSSRFQQPPAVGLGRSPDLMPVCSRLSPHARPQVADCIMGSSSGNSTRRAPTAEPARDALRAADILRAATEGRAADAGTRPGGAGAARAAGSHLSSARGGNGLGLSTVTRAAAAAAGGEAWLTSHSAGPSGGVTLVFHMLVPATVPPENDEAAPGLLERALNKGLGLRSSSKGEALWALGIQPKGSGEQAASAPRGPTGQRPGPFPDPRPVAFPKSTLRSRAMPPLQAATVGRAASAGPGAPADGVRDAAPTACGLPVRGCTPELSEAESSGRAALEKLVRADCSVPSSSDSHPPGKQAIAGVRPPAVETGDPGSGTAVLFTAANQRGLMAVSAPTPDALPAARTGLVLTSGGTPHHSTSPLVPQEDADSAPAITVRLADVNSVSASACASSRTGEWGQPSPESPSTPAGLSACPSGEWGYSACSVSATAGRPFSSQPPAPSGGTSDGSTLRLAAATTQPNGDAVRGDACVDGDLDGAEPPWTEELVIYGVDDSALMRRMLDTLSTSVLGCRPERCAMLGATMGEVDAFIDVAMGKAPARPGMAPLAAHLVIVDQHLTFDNGADDEVEMLGTNLVEELHELGFAGVVCVHSGALDYARLVQLPGVDMVVQKGSLSLAEFGEELRAAITMKQPHARLP